MIYCNICRASYCDHMAVTGTTVGHTARWVGQMAKIESMANMINQKPRANKKLLLLRRTK